MCVFSKREYFLEKHEDKKRPRWVDAMVNLNEREGALLLQKSTFFSEFLCMVFGWWCVCVRNIFICQNEKCSQLDEKKVDGWILQRVQYLLDI